MLKVLLSVVMVLAAASMSANNLTMLDKDGNSIGKIVFDEAKNTANITFSNNKSVVLNGVPMASGAKYANDEYEYNEWHGNIELKKGDEIIYESHK